MKKAYLAGVILLMITLAFLLLREAKDTLPSNKEPAAGADPLAPVSLSGEAPGSRQNEPLAPWDIRLKTRSGETALSPARTRVVTEFKKTISGASVDFDPVTKSPKWIGSTTRLLTVPRAELAAKDADAPIRQFIEAHRALFGHGPEVLDQARRVADYSTARGPSRKVVWHQQVDGIDVFEAILQANLTTSSALINIGSQMMPEAEKSLDQATRTALTANPPVSAEQAVAAAGANVGEKISADAVRPMGPPKAQPDKRQQFRATMLTDAEAGLVWVPMDEKTLRLAWDVTLTSRSRAEMYRVLVDVQTAEVLVRQPLTAYISPASYRVYTKESPTPFSPGHESPSSLQPAAINRELVTTSALDTNASPNGWINDADNITTGNNTDTYTDADNSNTPDLPRTTGSPNRVFDFPLDLTQAPSNFKDASNTQLFYWTNFMHDRLYQLGFTEAAGNFQLDNFGRGGLASDPVNAEAQDGSGTDNANFSTPVDGGRGRMQMYLWTAPTPDRDGSFEAEVVLHEYAHGLSNRLVGGPSVTISSLSSRGMGEGWSDFYGLALTAESTDNPHGNWARGGWSRYLSSSWLSENYYYGARRYSYSTDMLKNPHTLRDIDPNQVDWHSGVPRNPTYAATQDATQVHYQGTVWCVTLWDLRANMIVKHGFVTGNERALFLVTEGMKYAPANPNFIQARDGILQAALVNHPADSGEVWTAFAKRGMGHGATAPVSTTTTGIVESYSVPDSLEINDRSGWNIRGNWNSTFLPASKTLTLSNDGASSLNWTASPGVPWLSISPASGTLAPGGNVTVTVTTQVGTTPAGFHSTNLVFTNSATGFNQPIGIRLYVTPPVAHRLDLSASPGWTTTGEWAFGTPTGGGGFTGGGTGNPDPASGATGTNVYGVNLAGTVSSATGGPYYLTSTPVDLSAHKKTRLRFMRWLNGNALANTRLTVQVSTDGATWREVFVNPGTATTDTAWMLMDYDISSITDLQSSVRVRWGYQNISSAGSYSGWNIDDIEFLGEPIAQFNLAFAASISESTAPVTAALELNVPLPSPLVVTLESSQVDVATVPATVTIPAGSTSVPFVITPVNDTLLDGSQTTQITASGLNISTKSRMLTVHDDETATLTLTLPATVTEGTTGVSGSLSISFPPGRDVAVPLSSNSPALTMPATVTIPAGSTGPVSFAFDAPDNTTAEGAKLAVVTANVTNWTPGTQNVQVTDDEVPTILITGPSGVREGDSAQTYTAAVNTIQTANLTLNLSSDDASELTVPLTVTIPAGQVSTTFQATVLNDADKDGAQTATITGSQTGYLTGSRAVSVADNEVASYAFATIPSPQKRNKPFLLAVSARDIQGALITNHTGDITLSATSASGPVVLMPGAATLFVNGMAVEHATVLTAASGVTLSAQDGSGNTGTSNAFDVAPVAHDSFVWSGLPTSTITANTLFNSTITAVDDQGATSTSYVDPTQVDVWFPVPDRTVGAGGTNTPKIYNTAAHDSRAQMILTSQELGSTPRWLAGILFTVGSAGGNAMSNVHVRMKHTDRADFVNAGWEGGGWQTVFSLASMPAVTSSLTFDRPFFYDGTRNVMIDFSFNGASSTTAGMLRQTPRTGRLLSGSSQSLHGDPLLWSGLSGPAFTIGDEVPNMTFLEARSPGPLANSPVTPSAGVWSGEVYAPFHGATTTFWLRALAPSGAMGFTDKLLYQSTPVAPAGAATVFSDGFESGSLGAAWNTTGSSGTTPRITVTTANTPKTGSYHMLMDNSTSSPGTFARNSPTLSLNLAGRRNVSLEWFAKSPGDESHSPTRSGLFGTFDSSMNYDGVAISQDGTEWLEISGLRGLTTGYGVSATRVTLDPIIQQLGWSFNSTFRLRFSQYDDLSYINSDGIALDEVYVRADPTTSIALSLPPTLAEGAVDVPFTITLPSAAVTDVGVTVACTPSTRLTTPSVVIIPAGQSSAQSVISAPQNFYTEGGLAALVTAQAAGFTTSTTHVLITDDERFALGLQLPPTIAEGSADATATVTISPPPPSAMIVVLSTVSTQAAVTSPNVFLAAGATSGTFTIGAVDDLFLDGTQSAGITATGVGMTSATASVDVLDNEVLNLTVSVPAALVEGGAPGVGTVTLSGLPATNTTFNLSSADVSEATVPASAVIPAGQMSVNFLITPVEDNLQDGAQSVMISATAASFTEGSATISVRDNDPSNFAFSSIPSPQKRHQPFPLIITAEDDNNQTLTDFNGTVTLHASGAGSISTSTPLTFTQGVWSGLAWLDGTGTGVELTANSANGATGLSNSFDVTLGGTAVALAFAPLPAVVRAGALLPLQISAVDADGVLVSETTGPVTVQLRTSPANAVVLTTTATLVGGKATLAGFTVPSTAAAVYLHATTGALNGQTTVFAVTPPVVLDVPPITGTETVFQDGFEAGLQPQWTLTGTNTHRTVISTANTPRTGSNHLVMDSSVSVSSSRNEATLTLDLAGRTGVQFSFWMKEFLDEDNGPPAAPFINGADFDGVAISADGINWYEVQGLRSANGVSSSYTQFTINLSTAAAARGLALSSAFKIRLNHYDDYPINSDGFTFDDVLVRADKIESPEPVVTVFQEDFETGAFRPEWQVSGTGLHRTVISSAQSPRGAQHLLMDAHTNVPARNEATLNLDLSGLQDVTLKFWMKEFGDEDSGPPADPFTNGADFDGVAISADGVSWHEVQGLRTSNFISSAYQQFAVDLSTAAATRGLAFGPGFRIRLNHHDNESLTADGFAFDDISLTARPVARLTLSPPASITEGSSANATVTLPATRAQDTVVRLGSSRPGQLSLPATTTIPAGQLSATFSVTLVEDTVLTGGQYAELIAEADGLRRGLGSVVLLDNESVPGFDLTLAGSSLAEGGSGLNGSVAYTGGALLDLGVVLSAAPSIGLTFPRSLTLPAGTTSATFTLAKPENDLLLEPAGTVFKATAGAASDSITVTLADNDAALPLTISLPASAWESDAPITGTVGFTAPKAPGVDLTVTLNSSNSGALSVPASVVIPAGSSTASFTATPQPNSLFDGTRNVTLTASASGVTGDTHNIAVLDDDLHHISISAIPSPQVIILPVNVTLRAVTIDDATLPAVNGSITLSAASGATSVPMTYGAVPPALVNGVWTGQLTFPDPATNVIVTAGTGGGITGASNSFEVSTGPRLTVPTELILRIPAGEPTANLLMSLTNTGVMPAAWSSQVMGGSWLTVNPASGSVPAGGNSIVTASFNSTGWVVGSQLSNTLRIQSNDPTAPQQNVPVTMTIVPAVQSFQWSAIPSPQVANVPFAATVTAKDSLGNTVADFKGSARLYFASAPTDTTSGIETGQYGFPFSLGSNSEYRMQSIYLPSEVGPAGRIETIACNVSNAMSALTNFTVRMKHTTKATYTGAGQAVWESSGWTTVYQANQPATSAGGWFVMPLTVPFEYDGVQNLMVDFSYDNISVSSGSATHATSKATARTLGAGTNGNSSGIPASWNGTTPAGTAYTGLTNIRFTRRNVAPASPSVVTFTSGVWSGALSVQSTGTALAGWAQHIPNTAVVGTSNTFDITSVGSLTLTVPASGTEGGTLNATVTATVAPAADLVVTLTSSDTTEATLPATVTILAGQTSTPVAITLVDDTELDGPQTASFTANAHSYSQAAAVVGVQDNDSTTVTVTVPATLGENSTGTGSLQLGSAPTVDLTVLLASSLTTRLTVPVSVVIPAGQTSASFTLTAPNTSVIDGTQTATITATLAGSTPGTATIDILDNESRVLTLFMNYTSFSEGGAAQSSAGYVSLSGTVPAPLTINLSSSDTTEATVPATITISTGSSIGYFTVTPVNDALHDGSQSVTLNAAAATYVNGFGTITITDDDVHHFGINTITSQVRNKPFNISLTAQDINNVGIISYTGNPVLAAAQGGTPVSMTPASTGSFSSGSRTVSVTIPSFASAAVITATDAGINASGSSNSFVVGSGPASSFVWAPLSSPKVAETPFSATITALDDQGNTATSFTASATLAVATEAPVGAGSTSSSNTLASYYPRARTQAIYTAAELGHAKTLNSLALNVISLPGGMSAFTVRLKHTSKSDYSGTGNATWETTGWTDCYSTALKTITVTGWHVMSFTTPFAYNGTDNVIVDISYSNAAYGSTFGTIMHTPSTSRCLYYIGGTGTSPLTWTATSPTPTSESSRPDIRLGISNALVPAITPAATGAFTAGVWTGSITALGQATNIELQSIAGSGSLVGYSNAITVQPAPVSFTLTLPASAFEGSGAVSGTLALNDIRPSPLVVNLSSNDTSEATVPATITIPANTLSVPVTVTIVNDSLQDGAQSVLLTAEIPGVHSTSASISVLDNDLQHFQFASITGSKIRNAAFSVTVTARNLDGQLLTGYTGSPWLAAADGATPLVLTAPGNPLTGFTSGSKTFNVTLGSFATAAVLTVTDGTSTGSSSSFVVGSGAPTRFVWTTINSPQVALVPFEVTIAAQDDYGNTAPAFTGTAALSLVTTPGPSITPTTTGSFTAGVWTGNLTLGSSSVSTSLRAVSGGLSGTSNVFAVHPPPPQMTLTLPASASESAGMVNGTLTFDYAQPAAQVINLSSNDTTAVQVPATVTMPAYTSSMPVTLTVVGDSIKDGAQSATITASIPGIHTTSATISVLDDELHDFHLAGIPSPQVKDELFDVTITARSIDGLAVANYSGTPVMSVRDGAATLPFTQQGPLTGFVSGVKSLNIALGAAAGQAVITVTDGAATGSSNPFAVDAVGPPARLAWNTVPSPQFADDDLTTTLRMQDAAGNTVTTFNGPVSLVPERPVMVGQANNVNEHPMHTTYARGRSQQVILTSQIGGSGVIESLAMTIADAGASARLTDFTIRLKHTTRSGYTGAAGDAIWESAGFTTVYQGSPDIRGAGQITFRFNTGFSYDGVSNLMIDYSHRASSAAGSLGPRFTSTSASTTRTIQHATSSTTNGDPLTWSGTVPAAQSEVRTTDVRLGFVPAISLTPSSVMMSGGMWTGGLTISEAVTSLSLRATAADNVHGVSLPFEVVTAHHAFNPEPDVTQGLTNALQWAPQAAGLQYQVQRSTTPDFASSVSTSFSTATQSLQTSLLDGQRYYYRLRMRRVSGLSWLSDWSPAVSSTQDNTLPVVNVVTGIAMSSMGIITGSATDANGISQVSVGAATATTTDQHANWKCLVTDLVPGENTVTVTASDNAVPPNIRTTSAVIVRVDSDTPLAASFHTQPATQWAALGQTARFSPVIMGSRPMLYRWTKDGKTIPGDGAALMIPAVKTTDAGAYRVSAQNDASPQAVTSLDAYLVAFTALPEIIQVKAGGAFKLGTTVTAPKGTVLTYGWMQSGLYLSDGPRGSGAVISGSNKNSLSVSRVTAAEAGVWKLRMELVVGGTVASTVEKEVQVRVLSQKPVLAALPSPMETWVSEPVDFTLNATESPTSYASTGLPAGLVLDKVTGRVTGRLATASKVDAKTGQPVPTVIKFTATNVVGTSAPVELRLVVKDHFGPLAGTFQGLVDRNPLTNFNHGGLADLTLAKTGVATGSFTLAGQKHSFVAPVAPLNAGDSTPGIENGEMAFRVSRAKPSALGDLNVALTLSATDGGGFMDDLAFPAPESLHVHGDGTAGTDNGAPDGSSTARFNEPAGIAMSVEGILAITDRGGNRIRLLSPVAGLRHQVSTFTEGSISAPEALLPLNGQGWYVAGDAAIRIFRGSGSADAFAGSPGLPGHQDGSGTVARFRTPSGMCADPAGNLYVTDRTSHVIRKVTPGGIVTTLAGKADMPGHADGTGSKALFHGPRGIIYDPATKTLLVADAENAVIRRVTLTGAVTTWVGSARVPGDAPGIGALARLGRPAGITSNGTGGFYVTDGGVWQIIATGLAVRIHRSAPAAPEAQPEGIVFDPAARQLVLTYPAGHRVEEFSLPTLQAPRPDSPFSVVRTPLATGIPVGLFNASLTPAGGSGARPQGHGHASLKVSTKAAVTFSGRLPDGQTWTAAGFLAADRRFATHAMLYRGTSSILGTFGIAPDGSLDSAESLTWLKLPQPLTPADVSYPAGFDLQLIPAGGLYVPGNLHAYLGLTGSPAALGFHLAGAGPETTFTHGFTLAAPNTLKLNASNPQALSLKIDPATGLISGQFRLGSPARTASFSGLILNDAGKQGRGHFLLPDSTAKGAPVESGPFTISAP